MTKKTNKINKKPPSIPGYMIEVTDKNRARLEKLYKYDIPPEVDYIVPHTVINDDITFWEKPTTGVPHGQREIIS
jgi:hypothetical protein